MLRKRISSTNGAGPEPPKPPVQKGNTITFEINYTDGELKLNNSGDGITYTKVTTNLKNMPEILGTGGKLITIPFDSKNFTPSGETVLRVKAFVDKYSPTIKKFISANIGLKTWNNAIITIDFSDFDASTLSGISGFLSKSGMASITKLELKNLDSPKLTDIYNKEGGGFWALSALSGLFNFDAILKFTECKTPSLKNISGLCQNIGVKVADLSGLDTTSVTTMERFFDSCYNVSEFRLMTPVNNLTNVTEAFNNMSGSGTFFYNKNYDYTKISLKGWTRTPV